MKKPEAIINILGSVLKRNGLEKKVKQYSLFEIWDEIVGPTIAKQARPQKMAGNTLVVTVKSSAWIQELSFMKAHILKKINEQIQDVGVKDIRFIAGMF